MKYLFCFSFILLFFGCSTKQEVLPLPLWVLTPPTSLGYFYGVGEGWSLQESKSSALNDLSSKLQVELSSNFSLMVSSDYETYTRISKSEINTQVEKLKFNNVKVEKTKKLNDDIYMLVSIKKKDFFRAQKDKLLDLDNKVESEISGLIGQSKYEKYLKLKSMKNIFKDVINKAYFLKAINKKFDSSAFISKYIRLQNLEKKIKDSIVFSIEDNINFSYFRDNITKKLNKLGFKTSKKASLTKAKMTHKVRYFRYKQWYTAKVDTLLEIISNGKTVQSQDMRVVGKSVSSKKEALLNASRKFNFCILKVY